MNNYDFNYNDNMLDKQRNLSKHIKFIQLKWLILFLVGFNTYHTVLLFEFPVTSLFVSVFIYYVSYKIISITGLNKQDSIYKDEVIQELTNENFKLNILLVFCSIDLIYNIIMIKTFFSHDDFYVKNIAFFHLYAIILKIGCVLYIRYFNSRLSSEEV